MENTVGTKERLEEFIRAAFLLDDEELEALDHQRPMTQNLFDSIIDKCMEEGIDNIFESLLREYPEFLRVYAEKIEREVEGIELPDFR